MFTLRLACPHCRRLNRVIVTGKSHSIVCPQCSQGKVFPLVMPDEARWFIARERARIGPFSTSQMQELIRTEQLHGEDMVWQAGTSHWVKAASASGLFRADPTLPELTEPGRDAGEDVLSLEPPVSEAQGPLSRKGIKVRPDLNLTIGDFQILKKLGSGGMGTVYLARQRSKNRLVALKMLAEHLARDSAYVHRFYREALVLAELQHPNLVQYCGAGEENGLPFFAMEYIDGFSTATLLKYVGRLQVPDALFIILCCARALAYAYSHHVVHRDIKPENILVTRARNVKIADLGLAKSLDQDLDTTDSGMTMGTPRYMAPEQHKNVKRADHRCDIYALGGVLYHMVTGELPFKGESAMELMMAKEQGLFPRARTKNLEVPPRLDLMIDKMLAKNPRYRYQTCDEVIHDLESLDLAAKGPNFDPATVVPPEPSAAAYDLVEILMIHDNTRDILLTQSAVEENSIPCNINVARDGFEAIAYLRQEGKYARVPPPNLIILGSDFQAAGTREVLEEIRASEKLSGIPLVVLAATPDAVSFLKEHDFQVNLTVTKPEDLLQFDDLIKSVSGLFLTVVERFDKGSTEPS